MTTGGLHQDRLLLVHAYVDGELDPGGALALLQLMEADPALAAERDWAELLQRELRRQFRREPVPPHLRARVEAIAAAPRLRAQPSWRALAASVALAAVLASGSTLLTVASRPADTLSDSIVSSHVRALMAPQPIDVASSDRHTVKPWFNGRIAEAPHVVDLAADGFPLFGGRIDVIARMPVPTLVYHHRLHVISLTATPAGSGLDVAPSERTIDGYNIIRWRDGEANYWAVSDLASSELGEFVRLFCSAPPEQ